jgi:2-dehydro-3-deoxy-D-arabinonate dehydratase
MTGKFYPVKNTDRSLFIMRHGICLASVTLPFSFYSGVISMKLVQFYQPGQGTGVGVVRGDTVLDLSENNPDIETVNDLIHLASTVYMSLSELVNRMLDGQAGRVTEYSYDLLDTVPDIGVPHLTLPLFAPEVWGFGVTYKRSAQVRDSDAENTIYDQVYKSPRPEAFFKATPSRCSGPNAPIGVRSDSTLTATEPELAYVLGEPGEIIGYTLCNDVSAWDIERENPLYLNQSKIYSGCCAFGPTLVTADAIDDPYNLDITCQIIRGESTIFEGQANTSQLARKFEELNEYLYRDNPIPPGTVVSTGTGIMVPNDLSLMEGDIVNISSPNIGTLSNPVIQL